MEKYILYSGTLLIISFLLIFFVGLPKYQALNVLKNQVSANQLELDSREKYFQELQQTSEEIKQYQENLSKIDTALPPDPDLANLFNFFQKISSQSGLTLGKIGAGTTVAVEGQEIKETRTSINVTGSYTALKNFIQSLENSARLIEIENISFTSVKPGGQNEEKKEEKDVFSFTLAIKVYSY